eukprot:Nk52_evm29s2506 gene=Nk52_evmTU29s2506
MYKNTFQGSGHLEIFGAQGSNPTHQWQCKLAGRGLIKKVYDKQVKSFVYVADGRSNQQHPVLELPRTGVSGPGLHLLHPVVCFQVNIHYGAEFSAEFRITDTSGTKRRLLVTTIKTSSSTGAGGGDCEPLHNTNTNHLNQGTACTTSINKLHAKISVTGFLRRNVWNNMCIDLDNLCRASFGEHIGFRILDCIAVCGQCRIRKIFTLKDPHYGEMHPGNGNQQEEEEEEEDMYMCGLELIPRQMRLPNQVDSVTQIINTGALLRYQQRHRHGGQATVGASCAKGGGRGSTGPHGGGGNKVLNGTEGPMHLAFGTKVPVPPAPSATGPAGKGVRGAPGAAGDGGMMEEYGQAILDELPHNQERVLKRLQEKEEMQVRLTQKNMEKEKEARRQESRRDGTVSAKGSRASSAHAHTTASTPPGSGMKRKSRATVSRSGSVAKSGGREGTVTSSRAAGSRNSSIVEQRSASKPQSTASSRPASYLRTRASSVAKSTTQPGAQDERKSLSQIYHESKRQGSGLLGEDVRKDADNELCMSGQKIQEAIANGEYEKPEEGEQRFARDGERKIVDEGLDIAASLNSQTKQPIEKEDFVKQEYQEQISADASTRKVKSGKISVIESSSSSVFSSSDDPIGGMGRAVMASKKSVVSSLKNVNSTIKHVDRKSLRDSVCSSVSASMDGPQINSKEESNDGLSASAVLANEENCKHHDDASVSSSMRQSHMEEDEDCMVNSPVLCRSGVMQSKGKESMSDIKDSLSDYAQEEKRVSEAASVSVPSGFRITSAPTQKIPYRSDRYDSDRLEDGLNTEKQGAALLGAERRSTEGEKKQQRRVRSSPFTGRHRNEKISSGNNESTGNRNSGLYTFKSQPQAVLLSSSRASHHQSETETDLHCDTTTEDPSITVKHDSNDTIESGRELGSTDVVQNSVNSVTADSSGRIASPAKITVSDSIKFTQSRSVKRGGSGGIRAKNRTSKSTGALEAESQSGSIANSKAAQLRNSKASERPTESTGNIRGRERASFTDDDFYTEEGIDDDGNFSADSMGASTNITRSRLGITSHPDAMKREYCTTGTGFDGEIAAVPTANAKEEIASEGEQSPDKAYCSGERRKGGSAGNASRRAPGSPRVAMDIEHSSVGGVQESSETNPWDSKPGSGSSGRSSSCDSDSLVRSSFRGSCSDASERTNSATSSRKRNENTTETTNFRVRESQSELMCSLRKESFSPPVVVPSLLHNNTSTTSSTSNRKDGIGDKCNMKSENTNSSSLNSKPRSSHSSNSRGSLNSAGSSKKDGVMHSTVSGNKGSKTANTSSDVQEFKAAVVGDAAKEGKKRNALPKSPVKKTEPTCDADKEMDQFGYDKNSLLLSSQQRSMSSDSLSSKVDAMKQTNTTPTARPDKGLDVVKSLGAGGPEVVMMLGGEEGESEGEQEEYLIQRPPTGHGGDGQGEGEVPGDEEDGDEEGDELDLLYDPMLNCYYDPTTNKYYELV